MPLEMVWWVDLEGEAKRRLAARKIVTAQDELRQLAEQERAERTKAALEADLADLREAMGTDSKDFGKTVKGFGDTAMEKSVPEKQVMRGR